MGTRIRRIPFPASVSIGDAFADVTFAQIYCTKHDDWAGPRLMIDGQVVPSCCQRQNNKEKAYTRIFNLQGGS